MDLKTLVANKTGLSAEVAAYGIVLACGYPLAFFYNRIPKRNTNLKHWFSISTTLFIMLLIFGITPTLEFIRLSMVVYVIMRNARSKYWSPVACFIIAILQLAQIHFKIQMSVNQSISDYSAMLMVAVIKATSWAYCIYDGTKPANELDAYQKANCIREFPSIIEYLGYMLFFNGVWIGPAIEYKQYHTFVNNLPPYDNIPDTTKYALQTTLAGVTLVFINLTFLDKFSFTGTHSTYFMDELGIFQKMVYIIIAGLIVRAKFHGVWKIAESTALITGLGYSKNANGDAVFDAVSNIDIMTVEFGCNPKETIDAWNKYTAQWLRRYVYVRMPISSLKLSSTLFMSAVWHGFYRYYLSFLSSILVTEAGRSMRRVVRPLFNGGGILNPIKIIYDISGIILTRLILNSFLLPFMIRKIKPSLEVWKSFYFLAHLVCILAIVVFQVSPIGNFIKKTFHPKDIVADTGHEIRKTSTSKSVKGE